MAEFEIVYSAPDLQEDLTKVVQDSELFPSYGNLLVTGETFFPEGGINPPDPQAWSQPYVDFSLSLRRQQRPDIYAQGAVMGELTFPGTVVRTENSGNQNYGVTRIHADGETNLVYTIQVSESNVMWPQSRKEYNNFNYAAEFIAGEGEDEVRATIFSWTHNGVHGQGVLMQDGTVYEIPKGHELQMAVSGNTLAKGLRVRTTFVE